MKSTGKSICARCGSPFPRGHLVRDDFGVEPPTAEHSFCSLRCRDAAIDDRAAQAEADGADAEWRREPLAGPAGRD
jgi:hypothetical protein